MHDAHPVKDFRYYADKAERELRDSNPGDHLEAAKLSVSRADVYARLAAAVPAPEPAPAEWPMRDID